jgi:hypothetical protein
MDHILRSVTVVPDMRNSSSGYPGTIRQNDMKPADADEVLPG